MKKIFLSLLALVGMAGGLLFTSCSGGGSKDKDGPARAMTNMEIKLWFSATPALYMYFGAPINGQICSVTYSPAGVKNYPGEYAITKTGKEGSQWVIRGSVHVDESAILNDPEFRTMLGVGDSDIQSLGGFLIYFYFNSDGITGNASVNVGGEYGENGDKQFSEKYPREATFSSSKALDVQYLSKIGFDYTVDNVTSSSAKK